MLHRFGKLLDWQSIQDVLLCEPCPPSLQYAKTDFSHVRGVMRVSIDYYFYSMLPGQPQMAVA